MALALLPLPIGCGETGESKEDKARAERQERDKQVIAALASKHNAVQDWRDGLPSDLLYETFTIHWQEALVRDDGRPIVFRAHLDDVRKHGDGYIATFSEFPLGRVFRHPYWLLRCGQSQAKRLLGYSDPRLAEFYVVARIASVERAVFQVSARAEVYSPEEVYGRLDIEGARAVVATGELVDFVPLD